jgi:flagellar biosynthesis chaperone FliJ
MMRDNGHNRSQLAKAESALQELEAKLEHTKALLAERKAERLEIEAQVKNIKSTGDINKMVILQPRMFALDKTIADLKNSESDCLQRIESSRRYLYTLYVKLEKLRQEAATLADKSSLHDQEHNLLPDEQASLRRLRLQIQAITGAE